MSEPYRQLAWDFRRLGWAGVIPVGLAPAEKSPPPAGYTGWAGIDPSGADVQAWVDGPEGGRNIAFHPQDGVIGIDVDCYDGKDGAAGLAELAAKAGEPLPDTLVTTARDDGVSGIRWYRAKLAPGQTWLDQPAGRGRGVEMVHRGHRYGVMPGSVHPNGGLYVARQASTWEQREIGRLDELTELPEAWAAALSKEGTPHEGAPADFDATRDALAAMREGEPCPPVGKALSDALRALASAATKAVHPTAASDTWQLARLGWEGHAGVRDALFAHADAFIRARGDIRGEGRGKALAEWQRLTCGAVGKQAGEPMATQCNCELLSGAGLLFEPEEPPQSAPETSASDVDTVPPAGRSPRIVDLGPWLDGSWRAPEPSAGVIRDDGVRLLYPGRWHTCDAPNEAGKSWLAIAHAREEILNAGRTVAYIHFEEELPGGTVARLVATGLPVDLIRARFAWLSNEWPWEAGHMDDALAQLPDVGLLILDGRNAACTRHGRDPGVPETVGWFRHRFVSPAARRGAAVLSLGHPVKAKDRQDERHGFGSTAWLDEVDGVAFRLVPSKTHPIRRGASGSASLHIVKDRYGEVSKLCVPDSREGWRYAGSLVIDDSGLSAGTSVRLSAPGRDADGAAGDDIDRLGNAIEAVLADAEGQRYDSERELGVKLRAAGVAHPKDDLPVALERLEQRGRLARGSSVPRRPRPGWLTPAPAILEDES